jgi:hypothetical protein
MTTVEQIIKQCVNQASSRIDLWSSFIQSIKVKSMAEIGVFRGDFASQILERPNSIIKYYMIDPWRHLDDWNKPANRDDDTFERFLTETKEKTDFASEKRFVLRGKTSEVIDEISDGELDFCYIDGDHTLKGIAIDLIRVFPKIRAGGYIGGDDFHPTIWQHGSRFEPTLVFPFAVYFAEAVGAHIYALPKAQFLIEKSSAKSYAFFDLTERYHDISLINQVRMAKVLKMKVRNIFSLHVKLLRRAKKWSI